MYPPWNFQHKMGGHVPGINHHPVPDRVLPIGFSHFVETILGCSRGWLNIYFSIDSFCRDSCSNFWGYPGTCEESWCHFVEAFSRDFLDDRESSYSVGRGERRPGTCLQNETWFFHMGMCSPNMIDITSIFSIHQESPVLMYALSFCTVFFAHLIL